MTRHAAVGLADDDVLALYRTMALARLLDQRIWALNRQGKAAFVVSSQGHEAAQIGTAWAVRRGHDAVIPYYRDMAAMVALGMSPHEILLGVFARADDPNSGGRQMPNHWSSTTLNVLSGSSVVATQLPHAAGIALASKLAGDGRVAVCYFGEGAASKGDFHESLNFAGIHRLPVVFVCENNGYAISVPLERESSVPDIARRASSYGCAGVIVDGNDVFDVYGAAVAAFERARAGGGPTLLECKTYRFLGHTSDDDDRTYRSAEEVEAWRARDPLSRLRQYVLETGLADEAALVEVEGALKTEVDEAARAAEAAAPPAAEDVLNHVYARPAAACRRPAPAVDGAAVERTVIDTVRQTLSDLLEDDDRVVVLGEDVGVRGGVFKATEGLFEKFGGARVMDTPLAESSIVGVAIGLAVAGWRPIAEIQFADFIHSAFDQLVSEAARLHYRSNGAVQVPLVVRAPWGGGVHGGPYHSQAIEAFFAHVPGLKVVAPSTPADVAGLLREAAEDPDPVLFLEHKRTYRLIKGPVPEGDWRVPIGVADVARPGRDLTIVTWGIHRHLALEAAEVLAADAGVDAEVVDLRTISPLDRDTVLGSAARTGRVLIVHEDNLSFGAGAEVAALVAEHAFYDLDAPVRRLATPDLPAGPFAASLENAILVGTDHIVTAARDLLDA